MVVAISWSAVYHILPWCRQSQHSSCSQTWIVTSPADQWSVTNTWYVVEWWCWCSTHMLSQRGDTPHSSDTHQANKIIQCRVYKLCGWWSY